MRRWLLRIVEDELNDAAWYREKWIDGWNARPSQIRASDRKIARLTRWRDRLNPAPTEETP